MVRSQMSLLTSSSAKSLTRNQVHYLAGFFDGEGSVGLYYHKGNKTWCPRLTIAQNASKHTRRLFALWAEVFGGRVYSSKRQELQLDLRNQAAILNFIAVIGQHCIGKRMQLIVLQHWLRTKTYSFRTSQTLKALKRTEHG